MAWENIYFSVTLIAATIYFYLHFSKTKSSIILSIPVNSFFSLFLVLRDFSIGVDAQSYYDFFDLKDINISEPLFNILKLFNFPPEVTLFLISLSTTTFIYCYFKKFSKRPYLVMAFYICTFVFLNSQINIIRQGLAIGLFHISLTYLVNTNRFKYYLIAFIACMTHYSSIIIYLSFINGRWLFNKSKYYISLTILTSIALYIIDFSKIIIDIAERIGLGTVAWYLSWDLGKPWEIKHLFFLLIPLCLYMLYKSHAQFRKECEIPLIVVLSVFLSSMIFKGDEMFADRLIYYTAPSFLILCDIFSLKVIPKSSLFIVFASIIWLVKTSFFQLPSWFIYYA